MSRTLEQLTAEIIQSQISSKQMTTEEIKTAVSETFQTLKSLQDAENGAGVDTGVESTSSQALDPKKSIQKNKVICLECRQEFKMLSGRHLASHSLDAKAYRAKYGIPARQPLCAKSLSEKRSLASKERGLPENLRRSIEARKKRVTEE